MSEIFQLQHHELLVDIDVLFDTRLAVLEEVDPELPLVNVALGWEKRIADAPFGIDEASFKTLYGLRDVDTLRKATQTAAFEFVRHWLLEAMKTIDNSGEGSLSYTINFYPYKLKVEDAQALAREIKRVIGIDMRVNVVNYSPSKLTPSFVRTKYDGMFMYDAVAWINANQEEFNVSQCRDTTLYAPYLAGKLPTNQEMMELNIRTKTVTKDMEITLRPLVNLELLDIRVFSSILPMAQAKKELAAKRAQENKQ